MTMQPSRPLRVTLIGFSTRSDNLGVGALTVAQVEILREIGRIIGRKIEITVIDSPALRTPYVTGPDIRILDFNMRFLLNPTGFFATVRRADLVIDIGAGDSFADIYGPKRLRRMFVMKFLTHLAGTPLVLAPQTIGPFTRSWSKRLALASIRRSALVATRDALSTEALRDLGYTGEIVEASDVALRLPYDPPPQPVAGRSMQVGINVSGLLMNGGYTRKNEFGIALDYPRLICDLIGFFEAEGARVHLVAHVLTEDPARTHSEDDFAACATLAEIVPGAVLAPRFASPSAAKSYIAGFDFFMGARMHACIAAFSSRVPVIPMAYSRKFAGLFGSLGYDRTVDCAETSNAAFMDRVSVDFARRADLAQQAAEADARGREKLARYEIALTELLRTLVARCV
jgi:polysaccharide pyruvyl transferase WcaK-like protein